MIQPETVQEIAEYPMYREIKWDFKNNTPVFDSGAPVIADGKEAVLSWAFRALNTIRGRYEIYTDDYGCELDTLIGQEYSADLKQAEAQRYIEECLLINPYIEDVSNIDVGFDDGRITITATLATRYGEVTANV